MASQDLINTIIAEAGGEGDAGIIAATWAIAQRAAARGQTMDEVIRQGFDGYTNPGSGAVKMQQNPQTRQMVQQVIQGVQSGTIPNPVPGADHFLSGDVMPGWARSMTPVATIGGHRFYASGQVPRSAQGTPLPPGSLPEVATALDVRRPVPPSTPSAMSPQLAAQRQLTAQLQAGGRTAPDQSFLSSFVAPSPQTSAQNAIAAALAGGQMTKPPANFNDGIFSKPAQRAPLMAMGGNQSYAGQERGPVAPPYSAGTTIGTVPTQRALPPIAPSNIATPRTFDVTSQRVAEANRPALATALEDRIANQQAGRVPYSQGQTVGTVPSMPRLSQAAQRSDNGQGVPAARTVPNSVVNTSVDRARAAVDPALQVALTSRVNAMNGDIFGGGSGDLVARIPTSQAATAPVATAALNAPRMTAAEQRADNGQGRGGVGMAPTTRVVPSVPVRPIPGPTSPIKPAERIMPQGPLPDPVAVAGAPRANPIMVTAGPRQVTPSTWPTAAGARPTGGIFAQAVQPAPIMRASAPRAATMPLMGAPVVRQPVRQPLNVIVQGANTQLPPPVNSRYIVNGQAVQLGLSNSLAGTSASGFGSDRNDPYSRSTSISG